MLSSIETYLPAIGQVIGVIVALAGFYLLVGLPWSLLLGGVLLAAYATSVEVARELTPEGRN